MAQAPYFVIPVDDEVKVTKHSFNSEAGQIESRVETEPYGFLVCFPAGHSIRVKDVKRLKELGFKMPKGETEKGRELAAAIIGSSKTQLIQHAFRKQGDEDQSTDTLLADNLDDDDEDADEIQAEIADAKARESSKKGGK